MKIFLVRTRSDIDSNCTQMSFLANNCEVPVKYVVLYNLCAVILKSLGPIIGILFSSLFLFHTLIIPLR